MKKEFYTIEDIETLSEYKQSLINNYLNKFKETRWREKDVQSPIDCLQFYVVQEYVKAVIKLSENDNTIINKYSVGGGN